MQTVRLILLFIHLLGWAALFGGLLAQAREPYKRVNAAMRDGVGTAFLSGLALVGVLEAGDDPVNHAKIGTKLVIMIAVLACAEIGNAKAKRGEAAASKLAWAAAGLALVNAAIAFLW